MDNEAYIYAEVWKTVFQHTGDYEESNRVARNAVRGFRKVNE